MQKMRLTVFGILFMTALSGGCIHPVPAYRPVSVDKLPDRVCKSFEGRTGLHETQIQRATLRSFGGAPSWYIISYPNESFEDRTLVIRPNGEVLAVGNRATEEDWLNR